MSSFKTGKILTTIAGILVTAALLAQQTAPQAQEEKSILSNGVFLVMLSVIILLLFIIIGMAEVVKAGAALQVKKKKESGNEPPKGSGSNSPNESGSAKVISTVLFLLAAGSLWAQQQPAAAPAPAEPFTYWRMGAFTFYLMLAIILFEVGVVYMLFRSGMQLLDRAELRVKRRAAKITEPTFLEKFNASVAVESGEAIMLDHDYDGIRELDNNLPPWWKYGFYVTIVFALVYLVHFHILHTGKSSLEEYQQQLKDGEEQVAQYRKTASNLVDETNVTLLTDASALDAGKAVFRQNCAACHGERGEGKIGPNFTDDYWLHGGKINDVFKSIKYGWTDKGMREWGSELKPQEIQQVASYIKSLRGTNPPNAKEKQGELYVEDGAQPAPAPADSAKAAPDTVKK